MKREFLHWMFAQWASIFCVVMSAGMLLFLITRSGEPGFLTSVYAAAYVSQMIVFYGLHWELQDLAYDIDPLRSDRLTSVIKMRASTYDKDW